MTSETAESTPESKTEEKPVFNADPTPLELPEAAQISFDNVRSQYDGSADKISKTLKDIAGEKDLPCINITTEDEKKILSKDQYVPSVIDAFNCDESYVLSANGGVKVRGNSTAEQGDEKPYRIKFEQKHNILGLHGGKEYKSWMLLRSYWNLAPDFTAFSLAKTIFEGKYYSSDCTYVNLYINGKPRGMYLLCEQNQAADDRIDVNEPKSDDTAFETGYLVEMDNYPGDDHPYFEYDHENAAFSDISGEARTLETHAYSVRSDIFTKGQLDFIERYISGAFEILYHAVLYDTPYMFNSAYSVVPAKDTYSTAREAVEAVFDLDSLANMVILEELVHNNDVGAGSFYIAVDFTEDSKYKKLTFLAPWDFNWAYEGSANGGYYASTFQKPQHDGIDRSNPWYITAMKADWFQSIVKEKWSMLSESGALKDTTMQVLKDCSKLKNDLGDDAWKIDQAKNIVNFVNGRIKWLDKQWLIK